MSELGKKLTESIKGSFADNMDTPRLKKLAEMASQGKATYKEANEYALKAGEALAKAYQENVSSEVLPDGSMDYELAREVLYPTTRANYEAVVDYGANVQEAFNKAAGVTGLKAKVPALDDNRVDGLASFISGGDSYDDRALMFEQALVNLSQHHIDAMVRENGRFLTEAGYRPRITREPDGGACAWCLDRAGTYDYGDEPTEIYERHRDCRCVTVLEKGGKYQDVWSKINYDSVIEARIAREEEINNDFIKRLSPEKIERITRSQLRKALISMDLQLFANKEKGIEGQTIEELKKGINSLNKQIKKHEEKIQHPEQMPFWESASQAQKDGLIKHWEKEIKTFKDNIQKREEEIARRNED